MTRTVFVIFLLSTALLCSGCWNYMEVEERAVISGIGVDKSSDGLLEISCQVINPSRMKTGTAEGGAAGTPVIVYSSSAKTVFEAMRDMASKTGRKLFFGHSQVLIIGEEAARDGLENILDFFNRDPEIRRRAFIAVVKGKAGDYLTAEAGMAKIPAFGIADAIEDSVFNSRAARIRIRDYSLDLTEASEQPVASRLELFSDDKGKRRVEASGTAVFKGFRLVGYLNEVETRGYLWATGGIKSGIVSVPVAEEEDKRIAMEILRAGGKIKPKITDDGIIIKIKVKVNGNIAEVSDKQLDINNPHNIPEWEKKLSGVIIGEVQAAATRARELNSDIFGFGEEVRRKYPGEWKQLSPNWEQYFQAAQVEVEVNTTLRRTGKIINPARPFVSYNWPGK